MSTSPISDVTVLAAIDRAVRHRVRPVVPIWSIFEHLGIPRRSRRVRTQIFELVQAGAVERSRVRSIEQFSLTPAGRRRLRRAGEVELPESPQHQEWRNAQVLAVQEIAHRAEIQHRDLKPANVMLDANGHPLVIDLGIAKIYSRLAPETTVDAASAPFTPQEPVGESPAMTRDTHAWAALTVFGVSGHDPYAPGNGGPFQLLDSARDAARPQLPAAVAEIVERCLDSDGHRRPANAMVLAADVDAALERERRREARIEADGSPPIPVIVRQGLMDALEADLEMFSEEVHEHVQRELEGEVHVLGRDNKFKLACGSLSVATKVHEDGHALIAISLDPAASETLDRDRDRGFASSRHFALGAPAERDDGAEAVRDLQQQASEHAQRRKLARKDERARPVVAWRGLLSLLREHEAELEDPLRYLDAESTVKGVRLRLAEPAAREILGETRIAPGEGGREMWGEVTEVSHSTVTIRPEERSPPMAAPSGLLRRDRRHTIAAIERQQRALDAVEYGRAVRGDLVSLLTDPATAGEPETVPVPNFVAELDPSKQAAVRAALGSRDVLLVRGPPGTGKTTFITELVLQELRRDSAVRILLASQSNAALDHALAGIHALAPGISLLRVAPPDGEKVAPSSEPFVLTKQLERWKQEAVEKGHSALREWAAENGLVLGDIEAASLLTVLAAGLRERDELADARQEAEAGLEELRGDDRRAGQTATVSQLARERQAEITELREAEEVCASRNREAVSALVELRQLPARTRLRSLSATELEDRASALLPQDSEAVSQARARLRVLADWHARFGLGPAFQAAALARSSVVAATCVGLGGLRGAESVEFDLVVVDEASKATAPELLIPLARARRIVLVGDDRQLPPYIEEGVLDEQRLTARSLSAEEVSTPLFTTLADGLPRANTLTLTHQHRMHPSIGKLVSACFYDGKLSSEPRERPDWLGPLASRPVTWLTTSAASERSERRRSSSFVNELEVRVIARFLRDADARARASRTTVTVAVLSGYAAQRDALEQRIARERAQLKALTITCQTVDAFQGQQADIVLLSLTRSNKQGKLGFIRERPRVNVAVSRARDTLVLVGDSAFARAAKGSSELRRVLDHIQAHPDDCTSIKATW